MSDKIIDIHNNMIIYLSKSNGEFYAINGTTQEKFQNRSLIKLMEEMKSPKWEPCDISAFGARKAWDGITRIKAKRRDVEYKSPDWRITQSSRSDYFVKEIGEEYHLQNYPQDLFGLYKVNDNNKKVFKKVKDKLQQLKDLEVEINTIMETELTDKLSEKECQGMY